MTIKPNQDFDIREAQRYVLSQISLTKDNGITNITQLRERIAKEKKLEKECNDAIKNDKEYIEHDKLGNEHYKLEDEYKKKADREELKAFQKFFDGVTAQRYSGEIWLKERVRKELIKKYPNASEEDSKAITERLAEKFRNEKTDYKKFYALSKKHDELWSKERDITRQIEQSIKAKFFGEQYWTRPNPRDFEYVLETISDREELRKAYNKYKSHEREKRVKEERTDIEIAKSSADKELFDRLVGE